MKNIWMAGLTMAAIYLGSCAGVQAQNSHPAVCQAAPSTSPLPSNISIVEKAVASIGDPHVLASLRGVRYIATISFGAMKVNSALTRIYPDRMILVTSGPGIPETDIDASPSGAYRQVAGSPKVQLPDFMRGELLKAVQRDRFYVGQIIGSGNVKIVDTGAEKIGEVEATALQVDVAGAKSVWYVRPLDGRLLRSVAQVPAATGMVDQIVDYSDWRICDGLPVPFLRSITQGTQISQEALITVEFNPDVSVKEPTIGSGVGTQPSSVLPQEEKSATALSDDEVKLALSGKGRDRWVSIQDMGVMAAQGNQVPAITLFMPEAVLAIRAESAKKQFIQYASSEDDRRRSLMIVAQGYAGKTITEGCTSITRVVLLSEASGGVVQEAYLSEPFQEIWQNNFGVTNQCQKLRAMFSLDDVQKVRAAALNGEFFVAVFSGSVNTKIYKVKKKHQSKLGLL
jgi:hypothetical protein